MLTYSGMSCGTDSPAPLAEKNSCESFTLEWEQNADCWRGEAEQQQMEGAGEPPSRMMICDTVLATSEPKSVGVNK